MMVPRQAMSKPQCRYLCCAANSPARISNDVSPSVPCEFADPIFTCTAADRMAGKDLQPVVGLRTGRRKKLRQTQFLEFAGATVDFCVIQRRKIMKNAVVDQVVIFAGLG